MPSRLRRALCGVALVAATVTTALGMTVSAGAADAAPVTALLDPAAVMGLLDARAALGLPAEIADYGVDEQAHRVVVDLTGAGRTPAVDTLLSGIDPSVLQVHTGVPAPHHDAALEGGDTIVSGDLRCTAGFPATGGGRTWLLTAGHCTRGTGTWSVETADGELVPIGSGARTAAAGTDVGAVPVTAGGWHVRAAAGTVAVRGATEAGPGAAVCLYGSTSGKVCGTVIARNRTVNFDGTVQYGMTATTICSAEGDSGGPYVTPSGQAQGIHSGGGIGSGCTSYFTPVSVAVSAFGLRLSTS